MSKKNKNRKQQNQSLRTETRDIELPFKRSGRISLFYFNDQLYSFSTFFGDQN